MFGWCVCLCVCAQVSLVKNTLAVTHPYITMAINGAYRNFFDFSEMWVLFYLILAVEAWRSQVIQHKACVVKALTPKVIWQLKAFHSRSFNQQCLFTFPLLSPSICYDFFLTLCCPLDVVGLRRKKEVPGISPLLLSWDYLNEALLIFSQVKLFMFRSTRCRIILL